MLSRRLTTCTRIPAAQRSIWKQTEGETREYGKWGEWGRKWRIFVWGNDRREGISFIVVVSHRSISLWRNAHTYYEYSQWGQSIYSFVKSPRVRRVGLQHHSSTFLHYLKDHRLLSGFRLYVKVELDSFRHPSTTSCFRKVSQVRT